MALWSSRKTAVVLMNPVVNTQVEIMVPVSSIWIQHFFFSPVEVNSNLPINLQKSQYDTCFFIVIVDYNFLLK